MFQKNTRWYLRALRSFLYAGILYKIARMFMKNTEKQTREKKPKRTKK